MGHSLKNQLEHAVCKCDSHGQSKRSDKFDKTSNTEHKIYSNSYRTDIMDLAKSLAKFIKSEYPDIRFGRDIKAEHCQEYLDFKAATCTDKTLSKMCTQLKKLENACKQAYPKSEFNWQIDEISVPASRKPITWRKNKVINEELADKIAATMKATSSSEAYKGVILGKCLGVRANEAVHLKVGKISFSGGQYGYGEADIVDGPDGGAKAGKQRYIPILTAEARDELKNLVEGCDKEEFIITNTQTGGRIMKKTLLSSIGDAMKILGIDREYNWNKEHALRKAYAQRVFDIERKTKTRKEAVSATNLALGHGKNRGEGGIATYVANIY